MDNPEYEKGYQVGKDEVTASDLANHGSDISAACAAYLWTSERTQDQPAFIQGCRKGYFDH